VVGRGDISPEQLQRIHAKLHADLAALGARLDGMFICIDDPENPTHCHKPGSGMLVDCLQQFQVQAHEAPMIGDELADLQAAMGAGCPGILVCTGEGAKTLRKLPKDVRPVATYKDFYEAVVSLLGMAEDRGRRAAVE
jgi:D-glycero-D-manno-heptose 1,7-bisphosphate phosphatase